MSLDPKVAEVLMKDIPELKQFRDFLIAQVVTLNDLSTVDAQSEDVAVQVFARKRAIDVLLNILSPLINRQSLTQRNFASDYVV